MKYAILYSFHIKPGLEEKFVQQWAALTRLIQKHEESLGSRLHKVQGNHYVAYALWPNEQHFEEAGSKMPDSADEVRSSMKDCCISMEVLHKMVVEKDLLENI